MFDEHAWLLTTLPSTLSGLGVSSCTHTRHHAHTASWLSAWANITHMFPSAIPLTASDLSSSTLPFARGLATAHHTVSLAATALSDNIHQHPLPFHAPSDPSIPELDDFGTRFPRAQQRIAAVVNSARWLEGFEGASVPARACMLSQADQGAMAGFAGAMSGQARMIPSSFITSLQLRLRMPLSILHGISKCSCGKPVDPHGDHLFSCSSLQTYRTPWHDLVLDVFCAMARRASFHVAHDSRRPRAASAAYSPHWCPDATLIHGHASGSHWVVDVVCPAVVTKSALPAAALEPLAVAADAEDFKRWRFGNIAPHAVLLPFAVEHGGALGGEARKFFKLVQAQVHNRLSPREEELAGWSVTKFCDYYHRTLSAATLKGLGHFVSTAAAVLRGHN